MERSFMNILGKRNEVTNPYRVRKIETNPPTYDKALLSKKA
jgi:hypothetical protein